MDVLARPRTTSAVNVRRYRWIRLVVVVGLTGVIIAGFAVRIPRIDGILAHSARNLYFHVPMWFAMMAAFAVSAYHSLWFLKSGSLVRDVRAEEAARVGTVFGLLGLVTGIVWARFTWYVGAGIWWNFDPKQTMAVVQLLVFGAYFVLRSAIDDPVKQAQMGAVYAVFAAALAPFTLYWLPRQMDSLHPGAEGSPAFSETDLAPVMRPIFYAASIGFIGLFWVLYTQRVRLALLKHRADPEPEW